MREITVLPVRDDAAVARTAELAAAVWREHYTPIIGGAQVEYMLDKFQSVKAIKEQIASGYRYYLVTAGGSIAGYFAVLPRENDLFLSKLYLTCENRGRGYAREILIFIEDLAAQYRLHAVTLTVNKGNADSINAYRKMGFAVQTAVVTDIGGGYVMDDYVMRKSLP